MGKRKTEKAKDSPNPHESAADKILHALEKQRRSTAKG